MAIAKWSAVAVTVLMGLANLALVGQHDVGLKILGPVLAVAAAGAVFGVVAGRTWGIRAVIAVGVINLVGAVVGAVAGTGGWPVGLVLSGLAIVLAAISQPRGSRRVATP